MPLVHAYIDGFSFNTGTLTDMQVWWDRLKGRNDFAGKELKVWVSESSTCGVYSSAPSKIYQIN